MAEGFGYGGVPYPFWHFSQPPHPAAYTPPYFAVESYGGFDPMTHHGAYQQSPSYGYFGTCKESAGGYYDPSTETSSPMEKQRSVPYSSSATVSTLADMLIRNSQEPFYIPIPPSGVCASTHDYSGYGKHALSVPSLPMPSLKTHSLYDASQTGIRLGDGRSFPDSSFPVNEATGHVKPLSRDGTVCSTDSRSPWSSQPLLFDAGNAALSGVNYKTPSQGRSSADDTGQSPVGDFPSPDSSPRVSSVVNAMHNLSQVLVYECFSNSTWLQPKQLESLDKVVENLTKCLKKITSKKTIAGEVIHVSCPNVVDLNQAPNVVAKNVKPLDSFGFKESVDKDEMTQSIKNILASNFPDGEENHPQTLLYKSLWLETEAALCSSTCLARYHQIQNETGNLKSQKRDASTIMREPFLNPRKSDSIMNIVEQETTETLMKDGSNCGNILVTMNHDAPQSSRFNPDPVDAVLSLMSRSFAGGLEQENHGNFKPGAQIPDARQPESTTEEKHNDAIDRFQQQETKLKLKSQNCSETRMDEQEDNPEASEMATIGRSSHMSDVMGRFQLLKRRETEQLQKSLNSVDFDSDSDNDQPRNKTQMYDYLWSGSMMAIGGNSKIETCANTGPSAAGRGYESPTSDWEHVLKDD